MKARRSRAACRGIRAGSAPATRPFTPTKIAIALCAAGFLSPPVTAGPTGGKVVAGSAEISAQGNRTDIVQHSDRAVIDWRGFSISPNEAVYFQQQSNRSVALNRVTGDQVSHIQGILGAKGQVILLNPNGILFGAGAQVHASSFIASTSWLSSEDFMAGRLNFTAPARAADGTCPWSKCEGGSIVNQGTVSAADGGLVAFVAPHVRNDGVIWARLGRVTIGSGSSFTIDLNGDGLVNLAIRESDLNALRDAQGNTVGARIEHTGSTVADGGKIVVLAANDAKQLVNDVINLGGLVRANTAGVDTRGSIVLSATNGRVNVTGELLAMGTEAGQMGGAISALAPNVKLSDKALVSTSGVSGGGAIALLGVNGEPAKSIDIVKGATLDASATTSGQGGTVSVTADAIEFRGAAFARGGEKSGDGGRVGLTGATSLVVDGGADAGAQAGKAGVLALNYGQAQTRIDTPVADTISRTLRTGTNVEVDAACRGATCDAKERRIVVSSRIDGRPDAETGVGNAGATLSIRADAIVVSNDVYTNDGDITLHGRTGFVQMRQPTPGTLAPGRVEPILFAGTGDIDITAAKDVVVHHLLTRGDVRLTSIGGNVEMWQRLGRDEYGPLKSLTIRALGTPASDAEVATVGNVRRLRDVAVATGGTIDIQVTRNIRLLEGAEYIDGQLTDNRIGLTAARKGEGGRKLIMQSARLSETGDLTASDWYWGTGTETNVNSQIYHLGADKNSDRPADGRWVDLTKTIKDTDTPTITPPGPNNLSERTKLARIDPLQPSMRADVPARVVVPDVAQAPPGSETAAPSAPTLEPVTQTPDSKQAATEGGGEFTVALRSPWPSDQAETARNIVDREAVVGAEDGTLETTGTAGGYSGGRGVAQSADVGRTRLAEAPRDVFEIVEHVVEIKQCAAPVAAGNTYFTTGAFGQTLSTGCR